MTGATAMGSFPLGCDYAWLATDSTGHLGIFVNAGAGPIPRAVLAARPDADAAEALIRQLPERGDCRVLVSVLRPDDFIGFARRGLFVYDWADVERLRSSWSRCYELVASPGRPVLLDECPRQLSALAREARFESLQFAQCTAIPVAKQLECEPAEVMMEEPVAKYFSRYEALGLDGTPAIPEEIETLQRLVGIVFPAAYKAFLLILGRDGGPDFEGSDCTIRHVPKLRDWAENFLREQGSAFRLPQNAVVFIMHQGYSFRFFAADSGSEDPPVFAFDEGDAAPRLQAESFSTWLTLGG
jgi:hypothetical protein